MTTIDIDYFRILVLFQFIYFFMILLRQHFSKDAFYLGQVRFTVVIDELLRGGYLRNVDRVKRIRNNSRWNLVHFLNYVRKFLLDTFDNVFD